MSTSTLFLTDGGFPRSLGFVVLEIFPFRRSISWGTYPAQDVCTCVPGPTPMLQQSTQLHPVYHLTCISELRVYVGGILLALPISFFARRFASWRSAASSRFFGCFCYEGK